VLTQQSAWIFNIGLNLAVAIFLGILAVGLFMNVPPLTAIFRSFVAFTVFALLSWAASLVWQEPELLDETEGEDSEKSEGTPAGRAKRKRPKHRPKVKASWYSVRMKW
jgi:hypothetical protein